VRMRGALPPVSVVIPCHNAGKWVRAVIESALDQGYLPTMLIWLVNGNSRGSLGPETACAHVNVPFP